MFNNRQRGGQRFGGLDIGGGICASCSARHVRTDGWCTRVPAGLFCFPARVMCANTTIIFVNSIRKSLNGPMPLQACSQDYVWGCFNFILK